MAKINLPYIAWREGRPRFVPGARERAMGFKGQDLKHDDGRWFTLDEASGFAQARLAEIHAQRKTGKKLKSPPVPRGRTVEDLWTAYTNSDQFKGNPEKKIKGLAESSQASYKKFIKPIMQEPIWQAPAASVDPIILRAVYDTIVAARGLAMGTAAIGAIGAAYSWGRLRGWLPKVGGQPVPSPATRLNLEAPPARIRIGTDTEISALVVASDHTFKGNRPLSAIGDAVLAGLFSGQRKRDILAFIPGNNTNARIELIQSKTGARVSIPMAPRLIERMAQARTRRQDYDFTIVSPNIIINEYLEVPYKGSTFAEHFRDVRDRAIEGIPGILEPCKSLADFKFPDLRDTAVTWYARAGSTIPEIAAITGHSLKSVHTVLKHYLALDAELADSAVRKMVDYMEREGLVV